MPFDPYRLVFPPFPATILATIFYQPLPILTSCPKLVFAGGLLGKLCVLTKCHYPAKFVNPKWLLKATCATTWYITISTTGVQHSVTCIIWRDTIINITLYIMIKDLELVVLFGILYLEQKYFYENCNIC